MTGSGSPNDYENPKLRAFDGKWLHPMTQKNIFKPNKTKDNQRLGESPVQSGETTQKRVDWFKSSQQKKLKKKKKNPWQKRLFPLYYKYD